MSIFGIRNSEVVPMRRIIIATIALLWAVSAANAQLTLTGAGGKGGGGGGASPTFTGTGSAIHAACGFPTSCTITTTATVVSGTVVAVAGVSNQAAGAGTIGITVCGTALTMDTSRSILNGQYGAAIGHGTVTGGTCTIVVTLTVAGIDNAGVAWGTLSNLNSSTPGTSCDAFYAAGQNSPYPCTGGLTVSASGFGIVGTFSSGATLPTNGGSITVDSSTGDATQTEVAIGHVTSTCTAAQCQYNSANFASIEVVGEPFR